MNTAALEKFAPAVRSRLIESVGRKLDFVLAASTPDYRTTFAPQVNELRELERQGRQELLERVAYTWFNRLAALRFLDARGWHPFQARVLTAASVSETQPELLTATRSGALPEELRAFTRPERLEQLQSGLIPSDDPQGELYRELVLAASRYYHKLLPDVFEQLDAATELLLPDDLLTEQSVVQGFRTEIRDEDCETVEVLGWLYQFYIAGKKNAVMGRKAAVPAEDIPAVTQLFTPHWIVRYLVENSLGRLWLLNRPNSRLRAHMPYYIEGEPETDFLKIARPEEIRVCDPAVGSGHMLTYAFDLLFLIYEEEGYAPAEIPALILRHNLHGLDICPRAAQLAELALVFKAREKSRRFFQPEHLVRPHIIDLRDVCFTDDELREYTRATGLRDVFNRPLLKLLRQFEEAKNFGSLIRPCLDEKTLAFARRAIEAKDLGGQLFLRETHLKVLRVIEQAEMLTQRYQVVVANPPYMGGNKFNLSLKELALREFEDGKADLYSCFLLRNLELVVSRGLIAMITLPNWMFLGSWKDLRTRLLRDQFFPSLIHIGRGLWGSDFGSCAFVVETVAKPDGFGFYKRLFIKQGEVNSSDELERRFLDNENFPPFCANARRMQKIPGEPIAYWVTETVANLFVAAPPLSSVGKPRQGLATGENARFLRFWWEPALIRIGFGVDSRASAMKSQRRWFPCNKGGPFRKWYGNNDYLVDWEFDGERIRNFVDENGAQRSRPQNIDYSFQEGMTWSTVTIGQLSMRLSPLGQMFETKGSVCFFDDRPTLEYALAFANTTIVEKLLLALAPTADYHEGPLGKLPFVQARNESVCRLSRTCLALARADWDDFETSWDFHDHPLLRPGLKGFTLEASWRNWEAQSAAAIRRMQELETENNRLFIAAYGLEGELQPEVPEAQITLARAEARRDVAAFLSYAVGCMMGRYSIDAPGLILANAGDTVREYLAKVGRTQDQLTFVPDGDGIIPVLDGEWFAEDIVARTRDFLRATFGDATLRENLRFIEDSLGKDLRKYFLTDFYRDHLQMYKKRPIYWLVQSPRKGFACLIYMHRYTHDTFNLILNSYLRNYLVKLTRRLAHLALVQTNLATTATERTAARKEHEKLQKTLRECEDWERDTLLPLAQQRIAIDLDDGVKVNYLKFGEALAPIPGLAAAEED